MAMSRTRVRFGRGAVALALTASAVLAIGRGASGAGENLEVARRLHGPAERRIERHVVKPGETLWEIASARVDPGEDPRRLIAEIVLLSGLGGSGIVAGQDLLIPSRG